jgi:hypothetical protein
MGSVKKKEKKDTTVPYRFDDFSNFAFKSFIQGVLFLLIYFFLLNIITNPFRLFLYIIISIIFADIVAFMISGVLIKKYWVKKGYITKKPKDRTDFSKKNALRYTIYTLLRAFIFIFGVILIVSIVLDKYLVWSIVFAWIFVVIVAKSISIAIGETFYD